MIIDDPSAAAHILARVNYYRLSGYWYPFRVRRDHGPAEQFRVGTSFDDVLALYEFDARLRAVTFASLTPIELAIRTLLGHELGRVDPTAHLRVPASSQRRNCVAG
ncbi:Abi family protein [uncultured Tessaracoccus sp.]|uniref:Abi family protein n=1 Tax=uncultured Tessaracoccus sp. TaxID=905023 RepID=UPI0025F49F0D|nr:Abi family protein [uncultured Tessaracoccus sp.]